MRPRFEVLQLVVRIPRPARVREERSAGLAVKNNPDYLLVFKFLFMYCRRDEVMRVFATSRRFPGYFVRSANSQLFSILTDCNLVNHFQASLLF